MKRTVLLLLFLSTVLSTSGRAQGTRAATEVRLDEVYANYNLTGKDVLVIMIDRGIDYHHPAFQNPDGTTRLAYVFDMINGNDGNPYGVGQVLDRDEINADLQTDGPPLSNDNHGHGTACTGIIAGNGAGSNGNNEFIGAAPEATIISIKLVQDGFPPAAGQPGETGFFNPDYIAIALQFAKDKIAELDLPSVTLMNIGSIGGPTDGTSAVGRALSDFAKDHTFVCGVGDDGGANNAVRGNIRAVGGNITTRIRIDKQSPGNLDVNLWYDAGDQIVARLVTPSGTILEPGIPQNNTRTTDSGDNVTMWHNGVDADFYGSTGNRREVFIRIASGTGIYALELLEINAPTGDFWATMNPSFYARNNNFLDFASNEGSINDYSASPGVISPTDYVLDPTWMSDLGPFAIQNQGAPGELWIGSSKGPTQDARLGIDFAAPGEVLFGPYSPGSFYSRIDGNKIAGGNGLYGIQNAVSAAAPLVTGTIALMLELNPDLSPAEILEILQNTSRSDTFTGNTPNNSWGHGKMDAKAALDAVERTVSTDENIGPGALSLKLYPNPSSGLLQITTEEGLKVIDMRLRDGTGRELPLIYENRGTPYLINLNNIPRGIYFIQINTDLGSVVKRVVRQ